MTPVSATAVGTRNLLRVPTAARLHGRGALAALVVALVVGILGMHALASHVAPAAPTAASSLMATSSTTGMTGMTSEHDAAMAAGASHASHDHVAGGSHSPTAAGNSVHADSGSGHDMASMAMLCVVMLAAAALTLLVLIVTGVLRRLLPAAFQPAVVRERALQRVRGTGPPHEWQFSVIRC